MTDELDLAYATCSYRAFRPEMGLAVRTTVYPPRFKLGYQLDGSIPEVAPDADWFRASDRDFFMGMYLAKLEKLGMCGFVDAVARIPGAADNRVVLLCFESMADPDAFCHRRVLAGWLAGYGFDVPELGPVANVLPMEGIA